MTYQYQNPLSMYKLLNLNTLKLLHSLKIISEIWDPWLAPGLHLTLLSDAGPANKNA